MARASEFACCFILLLLHPLHASLCLGETGSRAASQWVAQQVPRACQWVCAGMHLISASPSCSTFSHGSQMDTSSPHPAVAWCLRHQPVECTKQPCIALVDVASTSVTHEFVTGDACMQSPVSSDAWDWSALGCAQAKGAVGEAADKGAALAKDAAKRTEGLGGRSADAGERAAQVSGPRIPP